MSADKAMQLFEKLRPDLPNWNLNPEKTKLIKWVYLIDYYKAPNLIAEIFSIDEKESKNQPDITLLNGDLLKIELTSHSIQGLSIIDFELALKLNAIKFENFGGIVLKSDKNYRMQIRLIKNELENKRVLDILNTPGPIHN